MAELQEVSIDKLVYAEDFNTRTDLGDLSGLAASITSVGVKEPILVKDKENESEELEVFAGFRRWEASIMAGKKTIPAMVYPRRAVTREMMLTLNLTENIQREDLNPVDEAEGFLRMKTEHGKTEKEISEILGVKVGRIRERLRLLKLSDVVKEAVRTDTINVKAALEIDRLPKEKQGRYVEVARELTSTRLKKMVDKELDKIAQKAEGNGDKTPSDPDKAMVTELVRTARKAGQIICNGLGYDDDEKAAVKDVNFRLLEIDDLKVVTRLLDDTADQVPDDIDVNEKSEAEIISMVESTDEYQLDTESPVVRQALIAMLTEQAQQKAIEAAEGSGRRPKVTFAIAKETLDEFFVEIEEDEEE